MNAGTYSALLLAALTACAPASPSREPPAEPIDTSQVEAPRDPPDEDGDGVDDARDRCCCSPEDLDGFEDEDGCPDRDNDGDGVLDAAALVDGAWVNCDGRPARDGDWQDCRDAPESYNGVHDGDGCPEHFYLDSVKYPSVRVPLEASRGRLRLPAAADARLRDAAALMQRHVACQFFVDTHGDTSLSRAKQQTQAVGGEVVERLVALGVARARLKIRGFGSEYPLASNRTPEGRAANRRVDLQLINIAPSGDASICDHGTPREREVCGCPKEPMIPLCTIEVLDELRALE